MADLFVNCIYTPGKNGPITKPLFHHTIGLATKKLGHGPRQAHEIWSNIASIPIPPVQRLAAHRDPKDPR